MNAITERLKDIIVSDLDINANRDILDDNVSLLESGVGLDSVSVMEFISIIEEKFGFEFSDDELSLEPFESLTTLTAFIAKKTSQANTLEPAVA